MGVGSWKWFYLFEVFLLFSLKSELVEKLKRSDLKKVRPILIEKSYRYLRKITLIDESVSRLSKKWGLSSTLKTGEKLKNHVSKFEK